MINCTTRVRLFQSVSASHEKRVESPYPRASSAAIPCLYFYIVKAVNGYPLGFLLHTRVQMSREGWRKEVSRRPGLAVLKCRCVPQVVKKSQNRRPAGTGREGERRRRETRIRPAQNSSLFTLFRFVSLLPWRASWSFFGPCNLLGYLSISLFFAHTPCRSYSLDVFSLQLRSTQPAHVYIIWCEEHPKMLLATKLLPGFRPSLHWTSDVSYIKKMLF